MSEQKDLAVPVIVLLAALGVAGWDASDGRWGLAVVAMAVGLTGAGVSLAFTLRKKGLRATAVALATLLALAAASPGLFEPLAVLPWSLAALAVAFHATALPPPARATMLAGAALLAVVAVLVALRVLPVPRAMTGFLLAGAFACAVQVFATRPRAPAPPPVGPEVAVFGGSFDPFHRGHKAICDAALKRSSRLLVIVAGKPPHKGDREVTPFHHRVAMARLGTEGMPRTEVLEMEGRREGPSYTVDTLDALRRLYPPGTRFHLVLGSDSFQEFPLWHDWEGILDRADLWIAARPGHDVEPPPEFEGRNAPVTVLECPALDVSSTALRRKVRDGQPTGDDLAPAVVAYVKDHGLYREEIDGEGAKGHGEEGEPSALPPS